MINEMLERIIELDKNAIAIEDNAKKQAEDRERDMALDIETKEKSVLETTRLELDQLYQEKIAEAMKSQNDIIDEMEKRLKKNKDSYQVQKKEEAKNLLLSLWRME